MQSDRVMVRIYAIAHLSTAGARLLRDTEVPRPRHAVVLAQLRCPAAMADFVILPGLIQPCPEAGEPKLQRWPHVIMDKHFARRHRLRHVEDVLHVTLLMCFPRARAWRYNAGAGSAYGLLVDAFDKEIARSTLGKHELARANGVQE
jgi:hypothetical protein